MTKVETAEAASVLRRVLDELLATASSPTFRRVVGALAASAETEIQSASLGGSLLQCFTAAREAGASFGGFTQVRAAAVALGLNSKPSGAVARAAVLFSLFQQARIVAATEFKSRDEVDRALSVLHVGFDAVEDDLAGGGDLATYRAAVALRSATVRDLTQRGRQLPRVITYKTARSIPAVVLANRLYGDASRADELIAENSASHPLFMPHVGRALSV